MSENYITSIVDEDNSIEYEIRDAEAREDISDLKSALNEVVSDLADETEYDFSTATVNSFYIASSAPNVWAKSSNRHGYIFPVNTSAFKVTITANSDYNVAYAFLKSNSQNSGSAVDYCDDTTRNSILPGESVTAFIPSDCTYMWVLKDFDGENHEPEELSFCIFADVSHFVSFMQEQTIGEAGKEIARNNIGAADSNKLNNLESVVHPINLAEDVTWNDGYAVRHANGTTYTSNSLSASPYIDISSCLQILYSRSVVSTTQSVPSSGIAFYDENKTYISGVPSIKADTGGYGDEIEVVPSGAKYARFTKRRDQNYFILFNYGEQYTNSLTVRVSQLENNEIENNVLGLHTKPDNIGVLNVIKRCRQMTDIKWTPAVDLPRYMYAQSTPPSDSNYNASNVKKYLGVFKAGVEYKGIPYGRADMLDDYGYGYSYVGMNIDFETFVTAVQNPESIISKENVGSVSDHYSIQYASVCSALTCYALGLSAYYATANIPNIPGLNLVSALKVNGEYIDPNTFKLGDVLNKESDHTSVITDIIKDSNGNTVFIEEAEATVNGEANPDYVGGQYGGLCRRVGFNIEDFFARYGEYSLYRYANIGSVTYTPSKFVNVGDEFDMARFSHLPCMPYMGEGFKYKSEYIPNTKIVITTDDYNYLRVFKDGTEITGSPFTVSGSYVETGFSEAGEYVAYLCNMSGGSNTIVSAKCHWSVI